MNKGKSKGDLPFKAAQRLELLDIPQAAKRLYRLMYAIAQAGSGYCYAKKVTLAQKMGVSERYVRSLVGHLIRTKAILEHPRDYGTAVYSFPPLPKPEYGEKAVPGEFRDSSNTVPQDIPQEFGGGSAITKRDTNVGLTSPNGEGETGDGGNDTLPKSSPYKGGGLSKNVRFAHGSARCARTDASTAGDDPGEPSTTPEGGKVVSIHPYDRLKQKVLSLDDQYDPQDTREWLKENRMYRSLSNLNEITMLINKLWDMGYDLSSECLEKALTMRLNLIDRSSISLANKSIRALHAAITKDYQKKYKEEKFGDENEHGESDEYDDNTYEEAKEVTNE